MRQGSENLDMSVLISGNLDAEVEVCASNYLGSHVQWLEAIGELCSGSFLNLGFHTHDHLHDIFVNRFVS